MATNVLNTVYLILTLLVLAGFVAAVLYIRNRLAEFGSTAQERLKSRGYDLSGQGMSVQTGKRLDREAYMDATQRGLVKALQASSYGREGQQKEATSALQSRKKTRGKQKEQT